MPIEEINNNLYEYIANNNFNGFYNYLIEKLDNSSNEDCKLIVETFLNNINHDKFYNMYAPVVKSALDNVLSNRKIKDFNSYKKAKEKTQTNKDLKKQILVNIKIQLDNRNLEGFRETLSYLINEINDLSELKETFSSVARLIESVRDDNLIYEQSKQIFAEIRNTSTLWQEEFERLNRFASSQEFDVNNRKAK